MSAPKPIDKELYAKVKSEADQKFLAPTSAYKSAWIVREYKKRNGRYQPQAISKQSHGLLRWFKEKWVDITNPRKPNEPCGRKKASTDGVYPVCRPSVKVTKETPKTIGELKANVVEKAVREKQQLKNRGRLKAF